MVPKDGQTADGRLNSHNQSVQKEQDDSLGCDLQ
jgi:hypothetical protein